jgi:hypothetical protein
MGFSATAADAQFAQPLGDRAWVHPLSAAISARVLLMPASSAMRPPDARRARSHHAVYALMLGHFAFVVALRVEGE